MTAALPNGQVSNHYTAAHWGLFAVPEVDLPPEYDGHTPPAAAGRLRAAAGAAPQDAGEPHDCTGVEMIGEVESLKQLLDTQLQRGDFWERRYKEAVQVDEAMADKVAMTREVIIDIVGERIGHDVWAELSIAKVIGEIAATAWDACSAEGARGQRDFHLYQQGRITEAEHEHRE